MCVCMCGYTGNVCGKREDGEREREVVYMEGEWERETEYMCFKECGKRCTERQRMQ